MNKYLSGDDGITLTRKTVNTLGIILSPAQLGKVLIDYMSVDMFANPDVFDYLPEWEQIIISLLEETSRRVNLYDSAGSAHTDEEVLEIVQNSIAECEANINGLSDIIFSEEFAEALEA